MAGRGAGDSRRRRPSDALRDLHADIEEYTQGGITVTTPPPRPAPKKAKTRATTAPEAAPAPKPRRRRELGRLAPDLKASVLEDVAPAEFVEPAVIALFTPTKRAAAPPIEVADDIDPTSRPWTPAAAMEPLPPLSPVELTDQLGTGADRRSWLMTAVVAVAAAAAIFVVVASHLDLGHTSAPSFAVNDLAATKDASDTSVGVNGHFVASTTIIDLTAAYIGAATGDQLTIRVRLADTFFAEHLYDLSPGSGTVNGTLTPKDAPTFKPGTYTIEAVFQGNTVRTSEFTVDPPAPPPAASPAPSTATPSTGVSNAP